MGGPDIDHQAGLTVPRRSLYFRHAAEKQMEFLQIFDAAGVTECYRRKESILPQQALALANSDLSLRQARRLARTLSCESGSDSLSFVTAAFEHVLARCQRKPNASSVCVFWVKRSGSQVRPWWNRPRRVTWITKFPLPTRPCAARKPGSRALESSRLRHDPLRRRP